MRSLFLTAALTLAIASVSPCAGAAAPIGAALEQTVAGLNVLPTDAAALPPATTRNGHAILASFRDGLADAQCDGGTIDARWKQQFARAPARLANEDEDVLPLFGYVVDELRAADLPTEFALIPFVESGYRPAARNTGGPAGLWQFIADTARNHDVPVEGSYDGRLSAVDSTRAAVRYLKTLHGMFGGDWRLAIMAYNAGEYRVLQSMRRVDMNAQNAQPEKLPGLSPITYAYVEKLHALACVLEQAQTHDEWMASLDREVPILQARTLPAGMALDEWARQQALQGNQVARLNPALGSAGNKKRALPVLAPVGSGGSAATAAADAMAAAAQPQQPEAPAPRAVASLAEATPPRMRQRPPAARRTHTVRDGDTAWTIAKRYGITVQTLLAKNGLSARSVLRPGMVLSYEE
ncbi:lytic transglycosylase domain-containing protein [Xanthomonas translucens]|uniref:lytic transglycosylase domain-containing protein n=4 Tax=Xanthomonas campestris pv. translucens TaxID=343 RepID=UPI0002A7A70B|nr:lytic transglycosylase domain-containing protein [Xanthomonas translucens]ELQ10061.1 membrane-bound murein hydrolase d precursor [Xanthomonas translucens DAR61454]MBC3970733.1 transglycosylase SLT domain-containing protein [Xanthomonas translucens pv. undulosa]MCT8282212.1 transglycosylase SLT domain-containing protein [Xanthomonas translucens pv. undulosa]MCT8317861.1 transglycosylase SLT domain-containing protein [Xanthomonas translucens pv. undulosa]QEO25531.1 transglycosylase SLT domain